MMDSDSSVDTPLADAVVGDSSSTSRLSVSAEVSSHSGSRTEIGSRPINPGASDSEATRLRRTAQRLHAVLRPEVTRRPVSLLESAELPLEFGRFTLLKKLGSGGFGVVFLADDPKLGRPVAIKIPHLELLSSEGVRSRFLRESHALAQLNDPHIVAVHEAGEAHGTPYLVLEYCDGGSLTEFVTAQTERPSPRACAELLQSLAQAMGHAHEIGLLHRDLKPRNVLLKRKSADRKSGEPEGVSHRTKTLQTSNSVRGLTPAGSPDGFGFIPKLSDFGLAKWLDSDDSSKTKVGAMVGTPQYMAPEQTEHDSLAVGPATDVHGLGLILYELLSGRAPYLGDSLTDTLRNIQSVEPLSIRQQRPSVPRDLETICFKALEKEPSRRYANGRELADDLQRFLDGRPIVARPVSKAERIWKWCRRRPELAALWFVVITALLIVSTGGWWFSVRISDSLKSETELRQSESKLLRTESRLRLDAERRERELAQRRDQLIKSVNAQRALSYATDMQLAQQLYDAGKLRTASELLLTLRPSADETDLRGFEWYLLRQLCGGDMQRLGDPNIEYWKAAMSPDRGVILASTDTGQFQLWDAHSLQPLGSIGLKPGSLKKSERIVQIAPLLGGDQWLFVTQNFDSKLPDATRLSLFDRRTQTEQILGHAVNWNGHRLEISPNGRLVATFENYTGPKLLELPSGAAIPSPTFTPNAYRGFAFSPDGQEVAISDDYRVHVVTIASQQHRTIEAPGQSLCNVTYSPKGDRLAALHFSGDVSLWKKSEAADWQFDRKLPLPGASDPERKWYQDWLGFEFSADGKRLAVARPNRRVVVWDFESDSVKFATRTLDDVANIVRFLPDGDRLLLHDARNFLHVWRPRSEQPQPAPHSREAWCVAFSPDGKLLASGSDDHTIKLWDVATAREVATLKGHFATVSQIRFSPDGSRLASISLDGTLRLWDIATATHAKGQAPQNSELAEQRDANLPDSDPPILNSAVPDPGRFQLNVVSAYKKGRTLGWSHDGRELVTGGYKDEGATLWDAESLIKIRSLPGYTRDVRASLFSLDGRWIVTVSNDSTLRVTPRDSDTPKHVWTEQSEIHSALFVDDGQTIALGLKSGFITIRDVESGAVWHSLSSQTNDVRTLAMTPDRKLLAAGDETGHLRFWNLNNGRLLLSLKVSDHPINGIAFSPDGNLVAVATHDGQVKLWQAPHD